MESSSENGKRISLYDNTKFLLIILVVIGHFADIYTSNSSFYRSIFIFIYAFHMPLFIFISGQFHKNENITSKTLVNISIGFLLKVILALLPFVLYGTAPKFSLLSDSEIPWYMFAVAIFINISYILRNFDKKYILVFSIILACFVGYDSNIGDYLYLSRVVVFYPFYVLGELIPKENIIKIKDNKLIKILASLVILGWAIACVILIKKVYLLRPLFTGRNPFSVNELFINFGFLYRALCYFISCIIGFSIISIIPNRKIPLFSRFGTRTLQVFFWHCPLMLIIIKSGIQNSLFKTPFGKILWILISVALTIILSLKIFSFPTNNIIKKCKEKNYKEEDKKKKKIPVINLN